MRRSFEEELVNCERREAEEEMERVSVVCKRACINFCSSISKTPFKGGGVADGFRNGVECAVTVK